MKTKPAVSLCEIPRFSIILPKKSVSIRVGMPPAFPKPRLIVERSRGKGKGTRLLAISRDVANALIQAGISHEG